MALATADSVFVGQQQCSGCHSQQHEAWQQSDHHQSMLPATKAAIKGNFDNVTFSAGLRTSRFFVDEGRYFIEITQQDKKPETYPVRYTFGFFPLQQYLLQAEKGRLQAFDVAWDSRPAEQGGQRWFQLQTEAVTNPDHPFHWKGYYQNWNSRCASCHSTNLTKGFDPQTLSFNTQFSDVNVACETCHGPGNTHVELVNSGSYTKVKTGLLPLPEQVDFVFNGKDPIARPASPPTDSSLALETCGACHSRRAELAEPKNTVPYHQQFQLSEVEEPLYFSDGQIRDEVFVLGSFLQSKMAQQGVTCTHCHDAHTGKTLLPGAQVCATCHQADVFAAPTHTNGHKDADCLSCHMPEQMFMKVDARRDHRFHRPSAKSENSDSPCRVCHAEESDGWFKKALEEWPKREGAAEDTYGNWANINQQLAQFNAEAISAANRLLLTGELPGLLQVALLDKMAPMQNPKFLQLIQQALSSDDPILRRAVAENLDAVAESARAGFVEKLAQDPAASVRIALANSLLAMPAQAREFSITEAIFAELEASLKSSLDHPGPNLGMAQLSLYQGDNESAESFYERALAIDSSHTPTLLNYAEYWRQNGAEKNATALLKRALEYDPDDASVQFAYGLALVRGKQLAQALTYLQQAQESQQSTPRFGFVYAVALWQKNRQDQAISVLQTTNGRWPGQYDIQITWAKYAYQHGDSAAVRHALTALKDNYADDPVVKQIAQLSGVALSEL
ncbi:tetratricopeptide repeat protein [Alteromonas pelagimontana]|uniref:Tetratricopeptide repeat protein n=1 Tax=Alteromonas pelagimontana TaxID=1858656 RepID=A0A6M4MCE2_9ALTE|nr:cytochrome c3 family protein [Alteromonas pelagimontana]QJR80707.1 tetratricopeptide repeat protein [Alteromonas pelagimontana]